jgi:broad specificity phosphatase PhoE
MKVLYLIRHGETTGDVEDRYGGDYDDHLTEKGKQQSRDMAEKLKGKGIEIIYTSPLIRARETGQILEEATGAALEVLPEMKERNNYGILTGMVKAEAKENHREQVELLSDYKNTVQGGESYDDFAARVVKGLNIVMNDQVNTMAIITHAGPIRVVCRAFLNGQEFKEIKDCAVVELENIDGVLKAISISNASLEQ